MTQDNKGIHKNIFWGAAGPIGIWACGANAEYATIAGCAMAAASASKIIKDLIIYGQEKEGFISAWIVGVVGSSAGCYIAESAYKNPIETLGISVGIGIVIGSSIYKNIKNIINNDIKQKTK